MQGQRSSMGSLPDTNPTATNADTEQPVFWNNDIPNYAHNMGPEYINSANQAQNFSGWNMGESSSSASQSYAIHSEQKIENMPTTNVDMNQTSSQVTFSPLFMQSARNNPFPQDLNMSAQFEENSGNNGGCFGEQTYSSEGHFLSRKRKAMEGHVGQSSSSGSSSYFQQREATPSWYNTNFGSSPSLENPLRVSPSEAPLSLNVTPNLETSRRTRRVRISPSPTMLPSENISGDSNILTSPQTSLFVPRTPHTGSSRVGYSLNFQERVARPNIEPTIPEIPIFVPRNETRGPTQLPPSWGLTRGNLNINGNSSRSAPISGPTGVSNRRRLSDFRRSLLSAPAPIPDSGGQSSNLSLQGGSSSQVAASSGSAANHLDHLLRLRSALLTERPVGNAFGSAPAGSEGRRQLVSEIRNVLDLMRRGEGIRMEDLVILDRAAFFERADIHDQHRDMRLDVDNMSYEELLALEERIGNVSIGLSEEMIWDRLKQRKFFSIAMGTQSEVEPCCICREEYNDGEDIGTVECGHEFHSGCIKQWLMLKNSCPICKTTALNK